MPLSSTVDISGYTISWTDDGWYQIQDSQNHESVCEGGTSCTVDAGVYDVINHGSGARIEFVTVPQQLEDSPVSISGNVISWPDDGWYQVQNANTYESICEGGLSCFVPDGEYIVINHSTGQRHAGIEVMGNSSAPALNVDNYLSMLEQTFEIYMGTAYDPRMPSHDMQAISNSIGDYEETREYLPDSFAYERVTRAYTCQNGGSLVLQMYTGISPNISYSYFCSHHDHQRQ